MPVLSARDILEADDITLERVEIPEWGGHAFLKALTGAQRDKFELILMNWKEKGKDFSNVRAVMVSWTLCDEKGNRIFESKDARKLGEKNAKVLNRLYERALELSGITEEDIEEIEENF